MIDEKVTASFSYTDAVRIARTVRKSERVVYHYPPNPRTGNSVNTWSAQCSVQVIERFMDVSTSMYKSQVVEYDSFNKVWVPITDDGIVRMCWLLLDPHDLELADGAEELPGYVVNSMLVGTLPSDGLPICLRSVKAPITTSVQPTTTTVAPCSGACVFTYTYSTKTWAQTSTTCSDGCVCEPPTFCPPLPIGGVCTSTVTLSTECRPGTSSYTSYPNCTGTTPSPGSTTTSTTPDPVACGTQCKWYYSTALHSWYRMDTETYHCNGLCTCDEPTTIPAGDAHCTAVFTPCVPPAQTTQQPCGGMCTWVGTLSDWVQTGSTCTGNCSCDRPSGASTCDATALTFCFPPGGNPSYTTPVPDPTGCNNFCLYQYHSGSWVLQQSYCPLCTCPAPSGSGTECEYRLMPCGFSTTTTSTTTTSTTSTTPAPGTCLRNCCYELFIDSCSPLVLHWYLRSSACTLPTSIHCTPGYVLPVDTNDMSEYIAFIIRHGGCEYWAGNGGGPPVYPHSLGFDGSTKCFCCDGTDFTTTTSTTTIPVTTPST